MHVEGSNREIQLQRAALPRILDGDPNPPVKVQPRTVLLRQGLDEHPAQTYFVAEEEVPRAGTRVLPELPAHPVDRRASGHLAARPPPDRARRGQQRAPLRLPRQPGPTELVATAPGPTRCTVAGVFEGFDEAQIEVAEGTVVHVRTAGTGPPVVLLHGYPQTGVCWHRVAPALSQRYSVVVPDLRGYGRSTGPPDDADHTVYAKRTMATDVVAVMSSLGHERFAVVGHDRGGRVSYRLALDHPDRVERLCTLDIVPTIEQFEQLAASRRAAVFGFHWYFLAVPPPLPETLIGAATGGVPGAGDGSLGRNGPADGITPEAMASYVDAFTPAVIAATCADYRAGATFDADLDEADRAAGVTIRCPVHVLWGDRRSAAHNEEFLATWRRWTAADQPVTGRPLPCGHFIPEELPGVVVDELLTFLG